VHDDLYGYQDPTLVRIILHNLLLNANKFTSNGTILISASIQNDWLTMAIKDTGKGMEADKLNSLNNLQPIQSSPGTKMEEGWGMGYKIITDLLRFTGGKLHITSRLNEGTDVTVKLPC
jgi:signal transduction histidine kinase